MTGGTWRSLSWFVRALTAPGENMVVAPARGASYVFSPETGNGVPWRTLAEFVVRPAFPRAFEASFFEGFESP